MTQKILVLNCYRQTLTVIRSLSSAGFDVILGVNSGNLGREFVYVSRYVSSTWAHPDMTADPSGFDKSLMELLYGDPQIKLIFPVGETAMRRLSESRIDLPPGVLVVMPGNEVIEACLDKPAAYRIAENAGIPVPPFIVVNSAASLRQAVAELGYPAIVKATDSRSLMLDKKCVFIRNNNDLDAIVGQWPDGDAKYIAQVEIEGARYNCDIVAQDGQVQLYFESEILRTDRYDGSGISVLDRSVVPDRLRLEYCRKFMDELNYTGVALLQFLHEKASGKSYFLEANPRPGATIALAVHCGVDLPAAAVEAHRASLAESGRVYDAGKVRCSLEGEIVGIRRGLRNREIGLPQAVSWFASACIDSVRADCHATFDRNDPRPTLKMFWNLGFGRLFGA